MLQSVSVGQPPVSSPTMLIVSMTTGSSMAGHICTPSTASGLSSSDTFVSVSSLSALMTNSPSVKALLVISTIATPSSMISVSTVSPEVNLMVALPLSASIMKALPSV